MDAVDSASRGAYGQAAGQLLLALAALAGVVLAWQRSLVRLMTSPDSSTITAVEPRGRGRAGDGGRGLGRLLPDSRTGTVVRRSLRYAWRDPKTKAAWVTSLAIGVIVPVVNALQGSGTIYLACLAAGLLGIQTFNQFGQDTSAFWMVAQTIASRRDAVLELRGRALALLLVTVPYTALVTVLLAVMLHAWGAFAETLGLGYALLGAMLGIGAVASSRFPYAVPQGSRKNAAPGQAGLVWISLFGGMVGSVLVCLPVPALMVWLHASGATGLTWLLLPVGVAYGAAAGAAGTAVASTVLRDRLPEILAAVSKA
jgi:ABC-2 type transport system permease protein